MKRILILIMLICLSLVICACNVAKPSKDVSENYQYKNYFDEENQLMLSYTDIFDSEGDPDKSEMVSFTSTKDNVVMKYWITPNTYNETPEEFLDRILPVKGEELEDNAVIGINDAIDLDTGEKTPRACYWVVDPAFIANIEISCETSDEAEKWYNRLHSSAIYLEGASGSDTIKKDEDTAGV
ncbi:hypothetical protein [Anaerovorax odorimutans]|uniref:hypothetical protein n=1 Tax=Anaerovorax odorimutans TaxID=109327 RepID=UPI0003FC9D1C|nr:hypothetical protein [Anaerovorax odorimutans]